MLSHRVRSFTALLAFPLAAVISCGGDSPFGPEADLTAEEIADAYSAMSIAGGLLGGGFIMAGAREAAMTADFTETINDSAPCPQGGTTSMTGSVTSTATGGSMDIRQNFNACAVNSETMRLWVFNGKPNIRTLMTMAFNDAAGTFTASGTMKGGFSFTSAGDSGNCSINLTMSVSEVGESFTGSVTGTVCGQAFSETL